MFCMDYIKKSIFPSILVFIIFLTSCSSSPTQTQTVQITRAVTMQQKQTTTTTVEPTLTSLPVPTATQTVIRPDLAEITLTNASALINTSVIGEGVSSDVKISPDGQILAYASSIGVRLFDNTSLSEIRLVVISSTVNSIDFSPDGSMLVAGLENGQVFLYKTADVLSDSATIEPIKVIKAHASPIIQVIYSNNSDMFLSVSEDRTIVSWNAITGKRIHSFTGFDGDITDVVFSTDYRFIAVGSVDGTIRVWNANSGHLWKQYGEKDGARSMRQEYPRSLLFDANSGRLVSGWGDGTIMIWQWQFGNEEPYTISLGENSIIDLIQLSKTQIISIDFYGNAILYATDSTANRTATEKISEFGLGSKITSVAYLADQNELVLAKDPADLYIYDLEAGNFSTVISQFSAGSELLDVILSSDTDLLISGGSDGVLRIWDMDAPARVAEVSLSTTSAITDLAMSGDKATIAVAVDNSVLLYSVSDLENLINQKTTIDQTKPIQQILTDGNVTSTSISADSTLLATAMQDSNIVQIWSMSEGKKLADLTGIGKPVTALSFSPKDNTLAAGSTEKIIYLWTDLSLATLSMQDSSKTIQPATIKGNVNTTSIVWSDQSDMLIVNGESSQTMIIDVLQKKIRTYLTGASKTIQSSAITSDGSIIATGGEENSIRIYNTATRKLITTLNGHTDAVTGLMFSASGTRLISWGQDGTIRLWTITE